MRDPQPSRPGGPQGPAAAPGADPPEPPALRRLRRLVSLLMAVLILGTVTVSAALVIRLGRVGSGGAPALPAAVALPAPVAAPAILLPEGEAVTGLGRGGGEILVITRDGAGAERLRAFDAATGAPRSVTPVGRVPGSGGGNGPAR